MNSMEQHRLIQELREHEMRMTRVEQELFEMFRKRDYDDEDLDTLSQRKLLELHEKFTTKTLRRPNPLDALFGRAGDVEDADDDHERQ